MNNSDRNKKQIRKRITRTITGILAGLLALVMVMTSVGKETRCGNFADQSSIAVSVSICNVGDVVTVTYSLAANSAFNFIGNVSFSGGLSLQSGSTTLYFENLQGTPISNSLTFKVTGEGDQSVTLSGTMNSMQFFVDEFTPESLGVNKSCGFHVKTSAEIAAEQAAAAEAARQAEAARKAAEEKAAQEAAAQQAAAQEAARKAQEAAAKKASEDAVKASEEAEKEAEEAEKKASEEAEKASKEAEEETEKATLEAPASSNSKGSKSNKKGENEEDPNAESAIGGEEKLPEEEDALTEDESDLEDSEGDEEESEDEGFFGGIAAAVTSFFALFSDPVYAGANIAILSLSILLAAAVAAIVFLVIKNKKLSDKFKSDSETKISF